MSDLLVPDGSQYQRQVDHPTLVAYLRRTYGGAVAIWRVCYGDLLVDAYADANIDGGRAARYDALGWYLYLIGGRDPEPQADTFARVLFAHGGLRPNEFLVVDDEEGTGDQSDRVNKALDRLDAQLRSNPAGQDWWYSGRNFAIAHDLPAARGHRIIAAYQEMEPTSPTHDLWQETDAASLPGVSGPVDASLFHGTISDFLRLIGATPRPALMEAGMELFTIDVPGAEAQQHIAGVNALGALRHLYDAAVNGVEWVENDPADDTGPVTGLAPYAPSRWTVTNGQLHLTTSDPSGKIVHCYQQLGRDGWVVERL